MRVIISLTSLFLPKNYKFFVFVPNFVVFACQTHVDMSCVSPELMLT